jgi:hypothetical protein
MCELYACECDEDFRGPYLKGELAKRADRLLARIEGSVRMHRRLFTEFFLGGNSEGERVDDRYEKKK